MHGIPLFSDEKVVPTWQAAQVRSATAEPAVSCPEPAGHNAHAAHAISPSLAANVPKAHGAQVRSLLAVATATVYDPAAQGALTVLQASAPAVAENVEPTWHAVHVRSDTAEPTWVNPVPAPHVLHAVHALFPAVAVKDPSTQLAHVRSLVAVAAAVV